MDPGASWSPGFEVLFGNSTQYPSALAFDEEGSLYVAGKFSKLVVPGTANIARWDGEDWFALDGGLNGEVRALAIEGTNVYVGGNFSMAGLAPASRIARWDGKQWKVWQGCRQSQL